MQDNHSSILKTVDKALRIIDLLSKNKEMGISEITRATGVNKSTVYRIVNTLLIHNFAQQNPINSKYKLGFKVLEISSNILEDMQLRHQVRPFLEKLRDKTNETVNLMVLEGGMGVYIDRVESSQRIRMVSFVGTREDLHCTAVGKALLAFLPESEVDKIIEKHGLQQKTHHTITNPDELKQHLRQVRKRGYSIDDEEAENGVRCIGAPIFNYEDKIEASISLSAPSYRLEKKS